MPAQTFVREDKSDGSLSLLTRSQMIDRLHNNVHDIALTFRQMESGHPYLSTFAVYRVATESEASNLTNFYNGLPIP